MERNTTAASPSVDGAKRATRRRWWVPALGALLAIGAAAAARDEVTPSKVEPAPAAAADGPPYRVGGDVTPPRKLHGVPPVYTREARAARVQGIAILEAIIDEEGTVTSVRVLKGLPMGLDRAAQEAVEQWRFAPATRYGQPVSVYFVVTVNFKLDGDFDVGPWLTGFMQQHADFGGLLREQRYEEAGTLLERWETAGGGEVTAAELRMARAYVLLGEKRARDAWLEVEPVDAPAIGEVLLAIASFASKSVYYGEPAGSHSRAETIAAGLAAADRAIELAPEDAWAVLVKSALLHSKAETVADPEERRALLDEEAALRARAQGLGASGSS